VRFTVVIRGARKKRVVFAGLFYRFYTRVLKLARGRKALSAFVCCVALSLGLLLPAYAVANLVAKEAVRLYQTAEAKARTLFDGDIRGRVQNHPLLQSLRLEKLTLQSSFEQIARKSTEVLSNAINLASRETFELISTVFVTFFTMFYFFRDGPQLLRRLKFDFVHNGRADPVAREAPEI
jgi:predicted PurR-regulated permease PerM